MFREASIKGKIFGAIIALLAVSLFISGCSSSTNTSSSDTSWEDVQKKGYFILGLDDSFPPMGFKDAKGEIVGLDIDLAKAVAQKLGVEVRLQPVSWDGVIMELNNKNIDLIWNGMTITEERKQKIDFSRPYLANRQIIVVQKNSTITSKADLADKVIGLQAGSSSRNALEKDAETYEKVKDGLVEFSTNDEALLDLKNGGVDAVIVDEVVGRYYIAKKPNDYQVLDEDFGDEEYGIGFRKGEQTFLKKVEDALNQLKQEGATVVISHKWFGADIVK